MDAVQQQSGQPGFLEGVLADDDAIAEAAKQTLYGLDPFAFLKAGHPTDMAILQAVSAKAELLHIENLRRLSRMIANEVVDRLK